METSTNAAPPVPLARLVAPLRSCHECRYCGPLRLGGMILCNHESWTHWDEEMRVFTPDFAQECESFAGLSRQNAQAMASADEKTPTKESTL